ncbi:hypothetical protein AMECASPLE_037802, partial [Ameca splendens]
LNPCSSVVLLPNICDHLVFVFLPCFAGQALLEVFVDFSCFQFFLVPSSGVCGNSYLDSSAVSLLSVFFFFLLHTQPLKKLFNRNPKDHLSACPPSDVFLQPHWSSSEEKETLKRKSTENQPHTSCQSQPLWGRLIFPRPLKDFQLQ